MPTRVDVVVVGAGLAGASAAWELARRGRSVVLLEQFERGHARGSSHGTERIVRLGYTSVEYVELGLEAMRGWRALEAECGRELLHVTGALDIGYDEELDDVAAAFAACGVRHEWLSGEAVAQRWPGLAARGRVLHQPDGGWIAADVALTALVEGARRRGAEARWSTAVEAVEAAGDGARVVTADAVLRGRCRGGGRRRLGVEGAARPGRARRP